MKVFFNTIEEIIKIWIISCRWLTYQNDSCEVLANNPGNLTRLASPVHHIHLDPTMRIDFWVGWQVYPASTLALWRWFPWYNNNMHHFWRLVSHQFFNVPHSSTLNLKCSPFKILYIGQTDLYDIRERLPAKNYCEDTFFIIRYRSLWYKILQQN